MKISLSKVYDSNIYGKWYPRLVIDIPGVFLYWVMGNKKSCDLIFFNHTIVKKESV